MSRPVLPFVLIPLIVTAVLALLLNAGFLSVWQDGLSDAVMGGRQPLKNIAIVAVDDRSLQEVGRWPWSRQQYVALLQKLNGSKLVGFDIAFFEPSTAIEDEALGRAMRAAGNVVIPLEVTKFTQQNGELVAQEWLSPVSALENVTTGVVNVFTDADGVSRSIPVEVSGERSLAFVLAERFIGSRPGFAEPRMLVNFAGRPFSFATYSFTDVINGKLPEDEFQDKIILIGATAPDLHDDYIVPTSWGQRMPGVEIHAHALQTILTRAYVHEQSFASVLFAMLVLAAVTAFLFWNYNELLAIILGSVLFLGVFGVAFGFYYRGVLVNLVYLPLTVVLAGALCIIHIARSEASHKKQILSIFGRYVSKDVVTHLLKGGQSLELGGVERELTALFVDIRGFTAISEKLKPQGVIAFLNHYFGEMTDIVFRNNGTLDKFIGDSIMALFNSPQDEPEHAFKAVKTAVEMQEACVKLQKAGLPKIQIGIGVFTGKAVVGNMGSKQRQEFTALGDTVNTASRLCGVAEGGQVIIGESTYEQCKDRIIAKKLPPVHVKGKEKALIVYDVTGIKKE